MTIERELIRLLQGTDHEIHAALRRYFRPTPRFSAPMLLDWVPLPDVAVVLGGQPGGGLYEAAARRVIDMANAADAALRLRRFEQRQREHPDWPLVVCEGDSWISHPFVDDLGDQLFDDDLNAFLVLNRGAAGDRLATVALEREHEAALERYDVSLLVLSGGGNDLLVQFGEFLRPGRPRPGTDPARLVTESLDVRLGQLMGLMRQVLEGIRSKDATVPVLVHGYDYMQVAAPGRGQFLGHHFDAAGIDDPQLRRATIAYVVDRFNEVLAQTLAQVPGVGYVDVRGLVPDSEWYDEIHPNDAGFRRVAEVLGERVRAGIRVR